MKSIILLPNLLSSLLTRDNKRDLFGVTKAENVTKVEHQWNSLFSGQSLEKQDPRSQINFCVHQERGSQRYRKNERRGSKRLRMRRTVFVISRNWRRFPRIQMLLLFLTHFCLALPIMAAVSVGTVGMKCEALPVEVVWVIILELSSFSCRYPVQFRHS